MGNFSEHNWGNSASGGIGRASLSSVGWHGFNLRRPEYVPRTLVDVGVAAGTGALYRAFPDAYLVLIEPLEEHDPEMRALLEKRPGEIVAAAAGAEIGETVIHVDSRHTARSSILDRTELTTMGGDLMPKTVPVTTLDTVMDDLELEPPFGLKIDTEGFELSVIEGAERFLAHTRFVIAEVSVAARFEEGYEFADFIAAMAQRGFVLRDILGIMRTPRAGTVFVDGLFVPRDAT